ncbi:hypothetical protein CC1G_10279 [Coprinopsis cinerea okayama7|uniref:Uncharacterized protein n=1 Tax=Coprinopsis cinerea (strain Okayama-7 / 130 / ATCC MYA-4618 / FGSC 9003) TaxID=240176 RepID=A8N158_COPC7|nr:hypothetical protein CC1G_10279 [Coprinopsis cinerea okayama7\|eukprot:XP_001828608.2 hypothetical protein CC1G_10279 [Coprinopsis cinerea okayama7\
MEQGRPLVRRTPTATAHVGGYYSARLRNLMKKRQYVITMLDGGPVEDYFVDLLDQWKIGENGAKNAPPGSELFNSIVEFMDARARELLELMDGVATLHSVVTVPPGPTPTSSDDSPAETPEPTEEPGIEDGVPVDGELPPVEEDSEELPEIEETQTESAPEPESTSNSPLPETEPEAEPEAEASEVPRATSEPLDDIPVQTPPAPAPSPAGGRSGSIPQAPVVTVIPQPNPDIVILASEGRTETRTLATPPPGATPAPQPTPVAGGDEGRPRVQTLTVISGTETRTIIAELAQITSAGEFEQD